MTSASTWTRCAIWPSSTAEDDRRRDHELPRRLEPEPFRAIADEVGALLLFDAAHVAGLIAGVHPDPVPYSDVVTPTTYKTLRVRAAGRSCAAGSTPRRSTRRCSPAGRAARWSTSSPPRRSPSRSSRPVVRRLRPTDRRQCRGAGQGLAGEGFRLVSGGTDNHLMVVDLRSFDEDLTGKVAQSTLDEAGITLNKNTVPDDPQPVRDERPAHRHPVGDDQGMTGDGDGDDRRADRPGVARAQQRRGAVRRAQGGRRAVRPLPGVPRRRPAPRPAEVLVARSTATCETVRSDRFRRRSNRGRRC